MTETTSTIAYVFSHARDCEDFQEELFDVHRIRSELVGKQVTVFVPHSPRFGIIEPAPIDQLAQKYGGRKLR
jgi:hypothetical protein